MRKFRVSGVWVGIIVFLVCYLALVELLIYYESPYQNKEANVIDTQWEGLWYTTVTIAAVGYGDYVPHSPEGKVIGYVFVLASIGLYGVFVSKLTNYLRIKNENKKMGHNGVKFKNHTVIIGWDSYAMLVVDQLVSVNQKVVIITDHKDNIELINEHYYRYPKHVFVCFSEFSNYDLLKKTGIEDSKIVFINLPNDTDKLVYVLNLKKEFDNLHFLVNIDNADLKGTFENSGVTFPLSKHDLSSKLVASYIFEPDVATLGEELLTVADNDEDHDIKQYKVVSENEYINKMYHESFFDIKKKHNTILLGLSKLITKGEYKLYKNPAEDMKIEKGDYLLVITNGKQEGSLTRAFGVEEGVH